MELRQGNPHASRPTLELVAAAIDIWRSKTHAPLVYVAGDSVYAGALAFYGAGAPDEFIDFDYRYAPWIDPADLRRRGLLAVCLTSEPHCIAGARRFASRQRMLTHIGLAHAVDAHDSGPRIFLNRFFMELRKPETSFLEVTAYVLPSAAPHERPRAQLVAPGGRFRAAFRIRID
jgi:hypothetical protein